MIFYKIYFIITEINTLSDISSMSTLSNMAKHMSLEQEKEMLQEEKISIKHTNKEDKKNETISICIPDVHNSVTVKLIRKSFEKLNFGIIKNIQLIEKKGCQDKYNKMAFIHFKAWFVNDRNKDVKQKLIDGQHINVVYRMNNNNMYFWKCLLNKKSH